MKIARLLIVLSLVPLPALGEIYKCPEEDGNVTYTNTKRKGCVAMDIEPSREQSPAAKPKSRANQPTPSDFPSVDRETQKQRDQGRRRILETELANEEALLADARRLLAEGEIARSGEDRTAPAFTDRVRKLRETVNLHEQNVAALRRELVRVK